MPFPQLPSPGVDICFESNEPNKVTFHSNYIQMNQPRMRAIYIFIESVNSIKANVFMRYCSSNKIFSGKINHICPESHDGSINPPELQLLILCQTVDARVVFCCNVISFVCLAPIHSESSSARLSNVKVMLMITRMGLETFALKTYYA